MEIPGGKAGAAAYDLYKELGPAIYGIEAGAPAKRPKTLGYEKAMASGAKSMATKAIGSSKAMKSIEGASELVSEASGILPTASSSPSMLAGSSSSMLAASGGLASVATSVASSAAKTTGNIVTGTAAAASSISSSLMGLVSAIIGARVKAVYAAKKTRDYHNKAIVKIAGEMWNITKGVSN
jgi:hypothetical protein